MINWHIEKIGDKKKQPVLLLHGFAGDWTYWYEVIETLKDEYYLIVPDLPGHAGTIIKENCDLSFKQISSSLITAISEDIFRKIIIIGYSMGGRLGLQIKTHLPDLIENGIFISCSLGIQDEVERKNRFKSDIELVEKIRMNGMEWFCEYWWNMPIFKSRKDVCDINKQNIFNRWKTQNPSQLADGLKLLSVGTQDYLMLDLLNQEDNSLFISGELDTKYTEILKEEYLRIPGARTTILEDCGHDILSEHPEKLIPAIENFLAD